MTADRTLRLARRRAGLSQRELASRTGVAQPTIARIEVGKDDPRFSTLTRLLRACNESLEALPVIGTGIDRSEIRRLLGLSPAERAGELSSEAAALARLDDAEEQRRGL
jgi:transcriptional regulator with XRE-family HTH domain